MPKLGRYSRLLNNVFFLYPTVDSAELGECSGGTGFLVAVPSTKWPGYFHLHGITNWHVAVSGAAPCIRINGRSNKPEIFDFDASDWIFQPNGYDVAISPPLKIDGRHNAVPIDFDSFFLTDDHEVADEIGSGDDVFMGGRFVDYDGVETNVPAVRFVHISIMNAPIQQPTGFMGRSVVVDMHSRSGFSGSPVFVYRTLGSHFMDPQPPGTLLIGGGHYMKLLGIHFGQFPEYWELKNPSLESIAHDASLITKGAYVKGLSGMTCVIPAACIAEVLKLPQLEALRTEDNYWRPV